MISQHLQAVTLAVEASRQHSREETALDAIPSVSFSSRRCANANAVLQNFIALHPDACEARKALAVKLVYQGYLYDEIQKILDVWRGSITGWKQAYDLIFRVSRTST